MKSVRPISLLKASSPDLDEVEVWRRVNRLTVSQRSEVIDRLKKCDDPVLRNRATQLLRACYVV